MPPQPSPETEPGHRLLIGLLLALGLGQAVDLLLDGPSGRTTGHVAIDLFLVGLSLAGATWLWRGWSKAERKLAVARDDLARTDGERDRWRAASQQVLTDLGAAIDGQLRAWGLTAAEREVAFLLLRGHSHKDIAQRSARSEPTVRQHAVAVYRKSGLGGRAELAAFFLGDLPTPPEGGGEGG
jgi:DNA-binding CsgD family transcriptional regulator